MALKPIRTYALATALLIVVSRKGTLEGGHNGIATEEIQAAVTVRFFGLNACVRPSKQTVHVVHGEAAVVLVRGGVVV